MSTMAVSSRGLRSSLNPNAPLFIPAAYQQVEDFSPEWWELVKTTGWFRDHWFRQHQEQETFDGDDEDDVANLLPDSFDVAFDDEFSESLPEHVPGSFYQTVQSGVAGWPVGAGMKKENLKKPDADAVIKNLSLMISSPKSGGSRLVMEPARYWEKPVQCVSPKFSPRRIIHQPR